MTRRPMTNVPMTNRPSINRPTTNLPRRITLRALLRHRDRQSAVRQALPAQQVRLATRNPLSAPPRKSPTVKTAQQTARKPTKTLPLSASRYPMGSYKKIGTPGAPRIHATGKKALGCQVRPNARPAPARPLPPSAAKTNIALPWMPEHQGQCYTVAGGRAIRGIPHFTWGACLRALVQRTAQVSAGYCSTPLWPP